MLARTTHALALAALLCAPLLATRAHAQEPAAEPEHAAAHDHIGLAGAGAALEEPNEVRTDLALFTLIVFLLLLLILWKFAWGPIVASLEKREATIANHIADAERIHEEAKLLLAQYEQKLAAAANHVREMMEEARRDAEHARQRILAEAKTAAEAERARALHEIEAATDQAIKSLAERSAQLAVDLAGKILKTSLSQADHTRLIQEAMAKFPAASAN